MMTKESNFTQVKEHFQRLNQLDEESLCAEFKKLQHQTELNQEQIQLLKDMLQADSKTDFATNVQAISISNEIQESSISFEQKQIGSYKVIKNLGEGGMGQVYLAQRNDGSFEQKVAIKLPLSSFNPQMLERFETERQILAQLTHNNIAHLLDGGTTDKHQPYLVMEYIQGLAIDQYCIKKLPDLKQRIDLIIQTCAAVSFAHQKLILHRDLKPSNILINESGQVKLLDFGIAKLLDDGNDKNTATHIMTRYYASPEQIQGKVIGTQSDLFSLAIIAYELITGFHPFKADNPLHREQNLASGKVSTISKRTNEEPNYPDLANISTKKIKGDLENILFKALHANPERRYTSVKEFANDLTNFCHNKPVKARKSSFFYNFSKLVQRHKIASLAILLTIAILIGSSIFSYHQAQDAIQQKLKAEIESDKSKKITQFMQEMFKKARPKKGQVELSAQDILNQGIVDLQETKDINNGVKFELMNIIFKSYLQLNKNDDLRKFITTSYANCQKELSKSHPICLETLGLMAFLEHNSGNDKQAIIYYEQLEKLIRKANPLDEKLLAIVLRSQFSPLVNIDKAALAINKTKEAIKIIKKHTEMGEMTSVYAYQDMIVSSIINENYESIEKDLEDLHAMINEMGMQDTETMADFYHLKAAYFRYTHKPQEALKEQRKALVILENNYPQNHSKSGIYFNTFASILYRVNQTNLAIEWYKKALDFYIHETNGKKYKEIKILSNLGLIYFEIGDRENFSNTIKTINQYDLKNIPISQNVKCLIDITIAQYQIATNDIEKASTSIKSLQSCTNSEKSPQYNAYINFLTVQLLFKQKKIESAKTVLIQVYQLWKKYPYDYLGFKNYVDTYSSINHLQ